ncbi:MAG TPA: histidine kinase, partial [Daejeonella sp.]|nr:histidine kinase [Daejeonella sp.]
SEIMRYMLYESNEDKVALADEIRYLENYIELQKLRFKDNSYIKFDISGEVEAQKITPLVLISFVENAFKHGVGEKVGDAWINIDLKLKSNILKLKISNSKPETISDNSEKNKGNIGLANLKKRLEILYPNAYDLKLFDEQDMFLAVLEIQTDKHIVF